MNAGVWGAHAARVLAMAARHRELSLFCRNNPHVQIGKIVSARAPKPGREARALPSHKEQPNEYSSY